MLFVFFISNWSSWEGLISKCNSYLRPLTIFWLEIVWFLGNRGLYFTDFANVKISYLPAFSSWLCDSFPSRVALGQRTRGINHITPRFRPITLT